ncbi:hypothetical protein SADUNF_Sadunf10G0055800 [Salix dunnii]|uniref:DUF4219 domain-containing protein n=1 Tax=Salix dunnii TaxID=1413687 RepID=A0A835JSF8_9ROSI|nr:hypothetical protein SADUNF_Sadunf10G0055800 [Salix dunnii]
MSSEASVNVMTPPVFDETNYQVWAVRMKAYLDANDQWEAVENMYEGYIACNMKRTIPLADPVDVISSDESSFSDADTKINDGIDGHRLPDDILAYIFRHFSLTKCYIVQVGLGKSIKQPYRQSLHYHTNILLKQWDQQRIGNGDEHKPWIMIHPCKAEATILLVEEVHRRTSTYHHVAKLLQSDQIHILL